VTKPEATLARIQKIFDAKPGTAKGEAQPAAVSVGVLRKLVEQPPFEAKQTRA